MYSFRFSLSHCEVSSTRYPAAFVVVLCAFVSSVTKLPIPNAAGRKEMRIKAQTLVRQAHALEFPREIFRLSLSTATPPLLFILLLSAIAVFMSWRVRFKETLSSQSLCV